MHPYATDSDERKYVPIVIALISVVMALLLYRGLSAFNLTIPWWLDAPSVLGFYGILYYMFDNYIWDIGILRKLGIVKVPDLSGVWKGCVLTSFDNQAVEHATEVKIRQNWSRISITLETNQSRSHSLTAMILTQNQDAIEINYEYQSEPKHSAEPTMHTHRGTTRLTLSSNRATIRGEYYTGRDSRNFGGLTLTRLS